MSEDEGELALKELKRLERRQILVVKVCKKCGVEKPISEFWKQQKTRGGYRTICKECTRIYLRNWQEENRGQLRKNQRNYWHNHKEEKLQYQRNYRKDKQKLIVHDYRKHDKTLLPLAENCELCGNSETLRRHHPDYTYPDLYITVCRKCHWWVHNG